MQAVRHFPSQLVFAPVPFGTRQTQTHDRSGSSLTVIGDGRLEPKLMDSFHSATAVQSVKDPRVTAFAREMSSQTAGFLAAEDGQSAVEKHFGTAWTFTQTKTSFSATLREGEATQGVTLRTEGGKEQIAVWANQDTEDSLISQEVTVSRPRGAEEFSQPQEFLIWQPSKEAFRADLTAFQEGNRDRLQTWVDRI